VNAYDQRQAWCNLQVKRCDPCLSTCVLDKALYKYSVSIHSIVLSYVTVCSCGMLRHVNGVNKDSIMETVREVVSSSTYSCDPVLVCVCAGCQSHRFSQSARSLPWLPLRTCLGSALLCARYLE